MPIELLRDELSSLYNELQEARLSNDPQWAQDVLEAITDAQKELAKAELEEAI